MTDLQKIAKINTKYNKNNKIVIAEGMEKESDYILSMISNLQKSIKNRST